MAINKMFIMLPVMLAARKLDSEDPNIVLMLRISYFSVQLIILCLTAYMYTKARSLNDNTIIYVPPPPTVRLLQGVQLRRYFSSLRLTTFNLCTAI